MDGQCKVSIPAANSKSSISMACLQISENKATFPGPPEALHLMWSGMWVTHPTVS